MEIKYTMFKMLAGSPKLDNSQFSFWQNQFLNGEHNFYKDYLAFDILLGVPNLGVRQWNNQNKSKKHTFKNLQDTVWHFQIKYTHFMSFKKVAIKLQVLYQTITLFYFQVKESITKNVRDTPKVQALSRKRKNTVLLNVN